MGHSRRRAIRTMSNICVSGIKRFPNTRFVINALTTKQEHISDINNKYDQLSAIVRVVDKQGVYKEKPFPGTKTMDIKSVAKCLKEDIGQTVKRIGDARDVFGSTVVVVVAKDESGVPVSLTQTRNAKSMLNGVVKQKRNTVEPKFLNPLDHVRAAGSAAWGEGELDQLEEEVAGVLNAYRPTGRGQEEVDMALQRIRTMLEGKSWGDSIQLVLFGSRGYGICNDSSDIDMMITSKHTNKERNKAEVKRALKEVSSGLRSMRGFYNIVNISSTRVPIVKFKYCRPKSGLEFEGDISCSNAMALHKTSLVKQYIDMDGRVRSVLVVLKKWAKLREISDSNTMNSYGLMMMALAFLISRRVVPPLQLLATTQAGDRCWTGLSAMHESASRIQAAYWKPGSVVMPREPFSCLETGAKLPVCEIGGSNAYFCQIDTTAEWQSPNKSTASQLLFEFFHFYGFSFDPLTHAVSPRLGSPSVSRKYLTKLEAPDCQKYLKDPKQWGQKLRLLAIEDPFETSLNCGRNAPAEWVEGLLWEMRRAASILAPGYHQQVGGKGRRLERLLLPPATSIYGDYAAWASVYRLLVPQMMKATKSQLYDPASGLRPDAMLDLDALEKAQMGIVGQETVETSAGAGAQRRDFGNNSRPPPRNKQRRRNASKPSLPDATTTANWRRAEQHPAERVRPAV
ncbi:hypothetical protein GGF40_000648 [Coemansia sp. RSA 1286]|nr:hypothetical protein IWW45_000388 [Coemansia sp. RSA 485]KAJ2639682.1 hypothetical protein GGF40_000648 [Coemansia sp. RSA 1286]